MPTLLLTSPLRIHSSPNSPIPLRSSVLSLFLSASLLTPTCISHTPDSHHSPPSLASPHSFSLSPPTPHPLESPPLPPHPPLPPRPSSLPSLRSLQPSPSAASPDTPPPLADRLLLPSLLPSSLSPSRSFGSSRSLLPPPLSLLSPPDNFQSDSTSCSAPHSSLVLSPSSPLSPLLAPPPAPPPSPPRSYTLPSPSLYHSTPLLPDAPPTHSAPSSHLSSASLPLLLPLTRSYNALSSALSFPFRTTHCCTPPSLRSALPPPTYTRSRRTSPSRSLFPLPSLPVPLASSPLSAYSASPSSPETPDSGSGSSLALSPPPPSRTASPGGCTPLTLLPLPPSTTLHTFLLLLPSSSSPPCLQRTLSSPPTLLDSYSLPAFPPIHLPARCTGIAAPPIPPLSS